jgi:hypothetical protein
MNQALSALSWLLIGPDPPPGSGMFVLFPDEPEDKRRCE